MWECNVIGFSGIGIYAGPKNGGFVYIVNSYVGFFDDDYSFMDEIRGDRDTPNGQSCSLGYRTKLRSTAVWIDMNDSYMSGCYLHCIYSDKCTRQKVHQFTTVFGSFR